MGDVLPYIPCRIDSMIAWLLSSSVVSYILDAGTMISGDFDIPAVACNVLSSTLMLVPIGYNTPDSRLGAFVP